jgi:DNA-binding transcriptional MocR family regulator
MCAEEPGYTGAVRVLETCGYVAIPEKWAARVEAVKSITTPHASLLERAVLHIVSAEGHSGRHVRRIQTIDAKRVPLIVEEAARPQLRHTSSLVSH